MNAPVAQIGTDAESLRRHVARLQAENARLAYRHEVLLRLAQDACSLAGRLQRLVDRMERELHEAGVEAAVVRERVRELGGENVAPLVPSPTEYLLDRPGMP